MSDASCPFTWLLALNSAQLCGRLQETVDLLHKEYNVISYEYVPSTIVENS